MPTIVSCLCWIAKGKAKTKPDKVQLEKNEIAALITSKEDNLESRYEQIMDKDKQQEIKDDEEEDIENLYGLHNYEDSDSEMEETGKSALPSFAGLACYSTNEDDPYVTIKDEEDDEETEDTVIELTDNLLVVGKADEEFSSIEVHVFSESECHSYCHHEILINSYPLTLEWLDYDPEEPDVKGNFIAVGSMLPIIEFWDIDLIDAPEPVFVLGTSESMTKDITKKKKSKKSKKLMPSNSASTEACSDSHADAVMGLSWNQNVRSILASASGDNTARIWDLSELKCLLSLQHPNKVQTLQWHPSDPSLLVTGCYDGIVRMYNCENGTLIKHWQFTGEIEKVLWNHLNSNLLLVSTNQMHVFCLDKSSDSPCFTIHAHTEAITDISLSSQIPGLLVTCSTDDTIKFWDIEQKVPVFLYSRTMHMGAMLCSQFCVDNPYTIAAGGLNNGFVLVNILSYPPLQGKCKQCN